MCISIQRWDGVHRSGQRGQWAVVLNGEHIMFVGDHRACEDWLDWFEAVGNPLSLRKRISHRGTSDRILQHDANWLRRICKSFRAFICGEEGSFKASESLLILAALCVFQAFAFIFAWSFIKGRVLGHTNMTRTSIVNSVSTRSGHAYQSHYDAEGLDIVCCEP